jgi:hypothetical protein
MSADVTESGLTRQRLLVDNLRAQRNMLAMQLDANKSRLDAKQNKQTSRVEPDKRHTIVARYASGVARRAADEITKGNIDAGYLRDLARSALFGDALAAFSLGEIRLKSDKNPENAQVYALKWYKLAKHLGLENEKLDRELQDLEHSMSETERQEAEQGFHRLAARAEELIKDPYS